MYLKDMVYKQAVEGGGADSSGALGSRRNACLPACLGCLTACLPSLPASALTVLAAGVLRLTGSWGAAAVLPNLLLAAPDRLPPCRRCCRRGRCAGAGGRRAHVCSGAGGAEEGLPDRL